MNSKEEGMAVSPTEAVALVLRRSRFRREKEFEAKLRFFCLSSYLDTTDTSVVIDKQTRAQTQTFTHIYAQKRAVGFNSTLAS